MSTMAPGAVLPPWQALLRPLVQAAEAGGYVALWIEPGGAVAQDAEGEVVPVSHAWSLDDFHTCWQALAQPWLPRAGFVVRRLAEQIAVERAADANLSAAALAAQGWLSSLAARTLAAALALGRNLLWTGPPWACRQLMVSLAREGGQRPGMWCAGVGPEAVPAGFVALRPGEAPEAAGVDRAVAWQVTPTALGGLLLGATGAQGWIAAGRLDRALMRFECGVSPGSGEATLRTLAAVDFVVVVAPQGAPRVLQVAELVTEAVGYRPVLIFAAEVDGSSHALVPQAMPSFGRELRQIGLNLLADDLRHAIPAAVSSEQASGQASAARKEARAMTIAAASQVARPPPEAPVLSQRTPVSFQPGWELDLEDASPPTDEVQSPHLREAGSPVIDPAALPQAWDAERAAQAAKAAALAAQFGLEPPPAPRPPAAGPTRPTSGEPVATPVQVDK